MHTIPISATRRRTISADWAEAAEFDISYNLLLMSEVEIVQRIRELAMFAASRGRSDCPARLGGGGPGRVAAPATQTKPGRAAVRPAQTG